MSSKTILIVEDDSSIAKNIQIFLHAWQYEAPKIASTAEEALACSEKIRPDLILMDIKIEGNMDGIELAKRIADLYDIPIIFLTGYSDDETVKRAKKLTPYGFLLKPFEPKELQASIEMALYKYKMEKKLKESEKKFRKIFEIIPDYFFMISNDYEIIECSYNQDHGHNPLKLDDSFKGQKIYNILPPNLKETCLTAINLTHKEKTQHTFEFEVDFQEKRKYLEARLLYFSEKRITIFIRDITKRKEAEILIRDELADLKMLDKMRGKFYKKMIQELKTTLIPLTEASEFLLREEYQQKFHKHVVELLRMINKGCNRMGKKLDRFLDMPT